MNYVGFYWTLPVGWLGIRDLPSDAGQAAKKSKTISYQRSVVQDWVKRQNEAERIDKARHRLIDEVTYIDKRPDRPTHAFLLEAMKKAGAAAARRDATLVIVEFGTEYRQIRNIRGLERELSEADIPVELLSADPAMVDGEWFIPYQHFVKWKEREAAAKRELLISAVSGLTEAIRHFGPGGDRRHEDISKRLNKHGIRTPTGRAWTADNVRKVITRGTWRNLSSEQDS